MKNVFLLLAILFSSLGFTQEMPNSVDEVIKWNFDVKYNTGNEATIVITVDQKDGWHIYAQEQPDGSISMPTSFQFEPSQFYSLVGKVKEYGTTLHEGQFPEKIFEGKKATFKQKIKINSEKDFEIKLKYSFMACLEACFPPEDRETTIKVKGVSQSEVVEEESEGVEVEGVGEDTTTVVKIKSEIGFQAFAVKTSDTDYELRVIPKLAKGWKLRLDNTNNPLNLKFEGNFKNNGDLTLAKIENGIYKSGYFGQKIIIDEKDSVQTINCSLNFSGINSNDENFKSDILEFSIPLNKAVVSVAGDDTSKGSYWNIFWAAFAGGLIALLTPCVFPMIPMTVSFFTKGSENRRKGIFKGVMYGFFILLIYVLLSVPFHLLDKLDPSILNQIATFGPLNVFFFVMLFVFALSFLGAFEIVLPAKWTNNADKKSDLGGLIGIFFMALTLALVSFSCTGPILGSLLASASGGGAWSLTWGMAGFGLALGLPFALFAIFPSWLNGLPSSGGWLNNVKVFLGFLELALAFKFLSNADLAWDAHLLERELFIAIWIGIFGALAMYLFGVFQTKHDSPIQGGLGTFRVVMGTLTLIFTMYLIPGLFGAPLKLISAFPPPQSYSEIPYGIHGHKPAFDGEIPEGAHFEHGLMVFKDFDLAKAYADKEGKPLMLDFTGEQCVNCRKMEANVWSEEKVHDLMNNDFVVVSLYVDDKDELPAIEVSPYSGRELVTYGDKWSDMQSVIYKKNTQPQYVVLDKNGAMINSDATYRSHGKPKLFEKWLKDAKTEYENRGDVPVFYTDIVVEGSNK